MKRYLMVLTVALSLSGCTSFHTALDVLSGVTVSPEAVVIASNTFNALEATATNYLRLKRCNGNNGPVCRDPAATKVLIPAIRTARKARNDLEQFLTDHPGQLGPTGLYDALRQSVETVKNIVIQYHIGAV